MGIFITIVQMPWPETVLLLNEWPWFNSSFKKVSVIHKPIQIKNLGFSLSGKSCFDGFTTQIAHGSRIAIIGRNGCGKTTLLKILKGMIQPTYGHIHCPDEVVYGFVPQIIEDFDSLSGGQRVNKAVTYALSRSPHVLLLDEPTNHLDHHNRQSLMRLLEAYTGTLIIVSHDTDLLRRCVRTLWHIDDGEVHLFSGNYDDYIADRRTRRASIELKLSRLDRQKKDLHHALMKEQKRIAKSKAQGEKSKAQRKWPGVVSAAKAGQAEEAAGRKKLDIDHKKRGLTEQLLTLRLPEIIVPKFSICSAGGADQILISIREGAVGYAEKDFILQEINLSIGSRDRIAIQGDNASGKSTLIKAILGQDSVIKTGDWTVPNPKNIGYLDQHYKTLCSEKTVYETISQRLSAFSRADVRRHLNDFLFRKNEEVDRRVSELSGGEKVRLTLAQIAALTPKLLVLDEVTNNLDLETKEHVIDVLKGYLGALIVISHDTDFLKEIGVHEGYQIFRGSIVRL